MTILVVATMYSVTLPRLRAMAGALSIFAPSALGFALGPFLRGAAGRCTGVAFRRACLALRAHRAGLPDPDHGLDVIHRLQNRVR